MNTPTHTIGQVVKTYALAALVALGMVGTAEAFNPQPEPPGSVMVGVTDSQTLQIAVVQPPDPIQPPEPISSAQPPQPIRVALILFDATGNRLFSEEVEVAANRIEFEDVDFSLGLVDFPFAGRQQVYAMVVCLGTTGEQARCAKSLEASVEVFDSQTGVTQFVIPLRPTVSLTGDDQDSMDTASGS